jgi:transcriptional regulator with XRE-family HTH domain
MPFNQELGSRLRETRERRSLSQRELARRAELTPQSLNKYESGLHPPTVRSLCRICEELSVPADTLLPEMAFTEEGDRLLYRFLREVWLLPASTRGVLATLIGCVASFVEELNPQSWNITPVSTGGSRASSLR